MDGVNDSEVVSEVEQISRDAGQVVLVAAGVLVNDKVVVI